MAPGPNRFDNISTADLRAQEKAAYDEHGALLEALIARLIVECPVKVDKIYRVKDGWAKGRKMLVRYVKADFGFATVSGRFNEPRITAEGPLDRKAKDKLDGWNRRYQRVDPDCLDLNSVEDPAPDCRIYR